MKNETDTNRPIVLVLEDVNETRDGIEKLLAADGYRVAVARDETDAIESTERNPPDLILVSLAGLSDEVIIIARRVREHSAVGDVPIVVFCVEGIKEGDEVAIGQNVHITRPDNFNQLRSLLARLLNQTVFASEARDKREFMSTNSKTPKPLLFRFIDTESRVFLELTNATERTLRSIEILTVFLKDEETPGGGPSQAHIRFDGIKSMQPREKAVLSHRTWINGSPADADHDQLERLRVLSGERSPYVLDISWDDPEGKTQFQRIPVGH